MEINQVLKELKSGKFQPIYFLCGEEEYFIDIISDYIEANALQESERDFNQTVLYGLETDAESIAAEVKRFPMMAPFNVVIVKEAQNIKKWEALESYFKKPSESTILVINHKFKKPDGRSKAIAAVKKSGVFLESKKLYENHVQPWVEKEIKSKGFSIEPKATALLMEFIGLDLSKLNNEISKLVLNLKAGELITAAHIEENIGLSKDYNVFELNAALAVKNVDKANKIIKYFGSNEKAFPIPMVLPNVYRFFSQVLLMHTLMGQSNKVMASTLGVSPFFLSDYQKAVHNYSIKKIARIMSLLRKVDLHSKGYGDSSSSNYDLLKELIFQILH